MNGARTFMKGGLGCTPLSDSGCGASETGSTCCFLPGCAVQMREGIEVPAGHIVRTVALNMSASH